MDRQKRLEQIEEAQRNAGNYASLSTKEICNVFATVAGIACAVYYYLPIIFPQLMAPLKGGEWFYIVP